MADSKFGLGDAPSSGGVRISDGYRPTQTTLVEDGERLSLRPRPRERNRCLLTVLRGPAQGEVLRMTGDENTLGRSPDVDLHIADPGLSRVHARIFRTRAETGPAYFIEDCRSTNGTFVEGRRIQAAAPIADGARIGLGRRTVVRFSLQDEHEEQAILQVHESARKDRLTGAFNRGVFDDRLATEFAFSVRHKSWLSVLLIDVDHFKQFNDTYGHQAGDLVLRIVAENAILVSRTEDLFARYGGEEFAVVARGAHPRAAESLAERIRLAVNQLRIPWEGQELRVTVSVGVASSGQERMAESPDALVARADKALYAAKAAGRNRVVPDSDLEALSAR